MPRSLKMTPAEVRRRMEGGETVTVLDARGQASHNRSRERIEGDLRVRGSRGVPEVIDLLPRDGWILAYCT